MRNQIELEKINNWQPPQDWLKITTIDAHTEGEPLRIIISCYPELQGTSIPAMER